MARREHTAWLSEAKNDFEMAEILLNSKKYNGAVFHAQQAAEKGMKSLQYFFNLQPWGHSISKLLDDLTEIIGEIPDEIKEASIELDRHYTTSRYPDVLPGIIPKDAYTATTSKKALKQAKFLLEFIQQKIGVET